MSGGDESTTGTTLFALLRDPTSPEAWERFVRRYGPTVHQWSRQHGLQHADAQEVTQTVLLKLHQHMRKFAYDSTRSFRAWLRTVTHNAWADFVGTWEHKHITTSGTDEVWLPPADTPRDVQEGLEREAERELLAEALEQAKLLVTPCDWAIFEALAIHGRSAREVAEKEGLTEAAVYMRKYRVRKTVEKVYRQLAGPDGVP